MKLSIKEKKALNLAVILAAIIAIIILGQFLSAIIAGGIAAVIFVPLNEWLTKKTKRPQLSISITLIISFLTLIIPLIITALISYNQVNQFITDIDTAIESNESFIDGDGILLAINERLDNLTDGRVSIAEQDLQNWALDGALAVGDAVLDFLTGLVSSVPRMVTEAIIFLYVFIALLGNHRKLLAFLKKLNPLGDDVSDLFMSRAKSMTNAMVKGQFVVAIAQGVAGAFFLKLAGIDYFAFFAVLLSVLSVIPLGGGILTIPIGIVMVLTGNVPGGLLILLSHFIVITNIDNVIRPRLVPDDVELHPALTMISVFAGLALFGFLGIVAGPVIFILALTTMQVYAQVKNT